MMSPLSSYSRRHCLFIPSLVLQAVTTSATSVAFVPFIDIRTNAAATAPTDSSFYRASLFTGAKHGKGLNVLSNDYMQSLSRDNSTDGDREAQKPVLRPLIVCGPSGVGKGTIISRYMEQFGGSNNFGFTVSHTTRAPRPGEVNGIHYHFVSREEMLNSISKGEFLEHAEVHGNLYGTSLDAIKHVQHDLGKVCLLDIDVQGVKKIKERQSLQGENEMESDFDLAANFVFIAPPSAETLRERLIGRGTESEETLERRTKNAAAELEYGLEEGNFDYIVVNGDLDQACRDFDKVVREIYGDFS